MLKPGPEVATRSGPGHTAFLLVAVVAAVVAAAGFGHEFVQDDLSILTRNPRMQPPVDWGALVSLPYWPPPWTDRLWRPLASVGLALQYQLGAGAPWVFRVVSLVCYTLVSVGVLALAGRLLSGPVALGVALLFAVHPLHIEAIALAVAQSELLVGLIAVGMTGWYLHRRTSGDGQLRFRDWALLMGGYLVAALSKEHGLVLPGLLVAAELTVLTGPAAERARRLWPGFALLGVITVAVLMVRSLVLQANAVEGLVADTLGGLGVGGRALTMLMVVTHWARLFLWPAHLRMDYMPQEFNASTGWGGPELLGLGLVLLVLGVTWGCRRRAPVVSFGLAWTMVALLPVSNVIVPTGVLLAERTLFLASIGVMIAVGGLADLAWRAEISWAHRGRWVLAVGTLLAVVAGAVRSARRWPAWQDETAYVRAMVADSPRSFRAQRAHGEVLFLAGRRAEGIAAYGQAIQYAPAAEVWRVRNDLARRYYEEGQAALAVEQLLVSRQEAPMEQETWHYLILGYLNLGEYPIARDEAGAALARGFSAEVFGDLRALADTALKAGAPPGSIRVRVVR
jgi:hypothetical protein